MSYLEVINIEKVFEGKVVLKDLSFSVEKGEMLGLVGASGCGKSTTLKIIAGLLEEDKGTIKIEDRNLNSIVPEKRGAVVVFQDYLLFPHMTVEQNIGFGLKMKKVAQKERKAIVQQFIGLVHLEGNEKKYPNELSGGQQQRVAIARALAIKPSVLLLDEPFSNLDLRLRENMRSLIEEIHEKTDTTIILVTHDKEEAFTLCDQVGIMKDGKILQLDIPKQLYTRPNSREVAEFFGEVNYIGGTIKEEVAYTMFGEQVVDGVEDGDYEWALRPEDIYFAEEGILAKIEEKKFGGDRIFYKVAVENRVLTMQGSSREEKEVGELATIRAYLQAILKQ